MKWTTAEKPITSKNSKLGDLAVAGDELEVPQAESIEDAVRFFGGEDKTLEFINAQIETESKNAGRVVLREAVQEEGETVSQAIARVTAAVKEKVKGWTYGGTRGKGGLSQKAAKERVDAVKARVQAGEELSADELLAMLGLAK